MRSASVFAAIATAAAVALAGAESYAQRARRSVECSGCIGNYYYFDQNSASGSHRDWNCGASSYDGHKGSDWSLTGGNGAIATGYNVVAIADGTVVGLNEGAYDMCNTCNATTDSRCGTAYGFGYGNYVRIDHGTRSVIYAHMRRGSVRVTMGARVTCGQVLGQIASSGCSTGAHLHTEFRSIGGSSTTAYDPYEGMCSPTRPSAWTAQNAYRTLPGPTCEGGTTPPTDAGTPMMCPAGTYPIWTCNSARTSRTRCIGGVVTTENCSNGCTVMPTGVDDVCAPGGTMCSAGVTAEWACNSARTARVRCNAGRDQTESCTYGCRVNSGDDTCNPAPMCSAGLTAEWTCASDGRSRRRCASGMDQSEPCANGCEARAGDDVCSAPPTGQDSGTQVPPQDAGIEPPEQDAGGFVPPMDGGGAVPARDAAATDSGSVRRDSAADGGPTTVDGGCACRAGAPAKSGGPEGLSVTAALGALGLAWARRRAKR